MIKWHSLEILKYTAVLQSKCTHLKVTTCMDYQLGSKGIRTPCRILMYSITSTIIGGITFSIKSLAVGDPVGRGRKTKRDGETEGGARVAGILMAPALPSVVMSLQCADKA